MLTAAGCRAIIDAMNPPEMAIFRGKRKIVAKNGEAAAGGGELSQGAGAQVVENRRSRENRCGMKLGTGSGEPPQEVRNRHRRRELAADAGNRHEDGTRHR